MNTMLQHDPVVTAKVFGLMRDGGHQRLDGVITEALETTDGLTREEIQRSLNYLSTTGVADLRSWR